jgi:hypothetical protein
MEIFSEMRYSPCPPFDLVQRSDRFERAFNWDAGQA